MARTAQRGISLIEVITVIALFTIVGGFTLLVSMETFRGSSFRDDRALLVTLLQRARAQSMNNVCLGTCTDGKKHGVAIVGNTYVVFQGDTYASRDTAQDAVFEASPTVARTGLTEVVFDQLSGDVATVGTVSLAGSGHTSVVTIGSKGVITWTN